MNQNSIFMSAELFYVKLPQYRSLQLQKAHARPRSRVQSSAQTWQLWLDVPHTMLLVHRKTTDAHLSDAFSVFLILPKEPRGNSNTLRPILLQSRRFCFCVLALLLQRPSPSKGQHYHAIELKREYYGNVTSLKQTHHKLVIILIQVDYGKKTKQHWQKHYDFKRFVII